MTAPTPSVLIIILNWNGKEDTLACLKSLGQIDYPNAGILVIDNASSDDSVAALRAAYPHIRRIENAANLGFVGGNNQGLETAVQEGYDYALLLNNDTEVAPDFLSRLVQAAHADPEIGITGPQIYYFARPEVLWSAGGRIDWQRGETSMIGIGLTQSGQSTAPYGVDFVTGCALLIKTSVVAQVGPLDERFFAYYEETEWCVRVARAGYRILLVPAAKIWHKISAEAREASPRVHYYMTRNQLLFLRCTRANWQAWAATYFKNARTLLSWTLKPKWRHKAPQRRAMWQAIADFHRGRFGKAENIT
ncbi:MAG: glycosyltransferase family 2 protein [Chloroflexota bacterium]